MCDVAGSMGFPRGKRATAFVAVLGLMCLAPFASASFISQSSDAAIPATSMSSGIPLDGTPATSSNAGWDVSGVDYSSNPGDVFASQSPTDVAPLTAVYFQTIGGAINPGTVTNEASLNTNINNMVALHPETPARLDLSFNATASQSWGVGKETTC